MTLFICKLINYFCKWDNPDLKVMVHWKKQGCLKKISYIIVNFSIAYEILDLQCVQISTVDNLGFIQLFQKSCITVKHLFVSIYSAQKGLVPLQHNFLHIITASNKLVFMRHHINTIMSFKETTHDCRLTLTNLPRPQTWLQSEINYSSKTTHDCKNDKQATYHYKWH